MTGCQKRKNNSEVTQLHKPSDILKLANGATLRTSVIPHVEEKKSALSTAANPEAYRLNLTLNVQIPAPATTMEDLSLATPELPMALPSLREMLSSYSLPEKKGSTFFYDTLFENKIRVLERQLTSLTQLSSRESLYDCQTILTLTNQLTQTPLLLIQAIMNVNADGSDGDRNIPLEKLSSTYQPQTNYRWNKTSLHPNPNIAQLKEELSKIQESIDKEKNTLEEEGKKAQQVLFLQRTVEELEHWSFLIGSADPFIVLPKFMLDKKEGGASLGDYAIVFYNGTLYPAIVGDLGPSSKIGEASLRICRAIDSRSSATHRPLSSPHVTYLVFPGSADFPFQAPNYKHWSQRCHELWEKIGGSNQVLWHEWEELDQPWKN